MKISTAIASRLNKILKERKLSAYRLEKISGVLHTTMMNVLNEKNESVNLKTLFQICDGLKISISDFFDDQIFDFENFNLE